MSKNAFIRIQVVGTYIAAIGALWEAFWWHEFVGFDLFGAPPHFLYHLPVLALSVMNFQRWLKEKKGTWLVLGILFVLILLNVPLQLLWNAEYGIPSRSGLEAYWSFPYTLPTLSFMGIGMLLFRQAKNDALARSMVLAWILAFLFAKARPFRPTGDVFAVWGPWGAGVIYFGFFLLVLIAKQTERDKWLAFRSIFFHTILLLISGAFALVTLVFFGKPTDIFWQILLGGFRHPPGWVTTLSLFGSAIWLDYAHRGNGHMQSIVAALIGSIVLYGSTPYVLGIEYRLSLATVLVCIVSSLLGGITASIGARIWSSMHLRCNQKIVLK